MDQRRESEEVLCEEDTKVHLHMTLDQHTGNRVLLKLDFYKYPELNGTFEIPAAIVSRLHSNTKVEFEPDDLKVLYKVLPEENSLDLINHQNPRQRLSMSLQNFIAQDIRLLDFDIDDSTNFVIDALKGDKVRLPREFTQRFRRVD